MHDVITYVITIETQCKFTGMIVRCLTQKPYQILHCVVKISMVGDGADTDNTGGKYVRTQSEQLIHGLKRAIV